MLAPTRELAKQVERELVESAPNLNVVCVYGGVSIENQVQTGIWHCNDADLLLGIWMECP